MDKKLLKWYQENKRTMPWRETHEPYLIWISEIMLQQTQVITVIDYYNRFIGRFKDVEALAEADEEEVLKYWEGLGYYSRARNLHKCAQIIVSKYNGIFPKEYRQLLDLPGIGPYTAGAISSISYNNRVPAVDGNVMRVYSRYFKLDCDISDPKSRAIFEERVMDTMPEDARHFNQAIMELGATICTPKAPKCSICPIEKECLAKASSTQLSYPIKTKKIKKKHEEIAVLVFLNQGKVMIEKKSGTLLLKGLWGFPTYTGEASSEDTLLRWIQDNYDFEGSVLEKKPLKKHVFTHLVWHMTMIVLRVEGVKEIDYPEVKWIEPATLSDYALPTVFKKNLSKDIMALIESLSQERGL